MYTPNESNKVNTFGSKNLVIYTMYQSFNFKITNGCQEKSGDLGQIDIARM